MIVRNALKIPLYTRLSGDDFPASPLDGVPAEDTPAQPPLPENPKKAWAVILEALGLPSDAPLETVDAKYDALSLAMQAEQPPSPEQVAALGRRFNLSEREVAMFSDPRHKVTAGTITAHIQRYAEEKRRRAAR